ncbi:DUF3152 domain-containing protein [Streptomyces sp. NPDC051569]|uniref:DUF3152 domain-containing protein n=1 Tax=Streptomyces sp. NPDC051569 TaxID=3365661 RepID=UPI00379AC82F
MGRHSRKDPAPTGSASTVGRAADGPDPEPAGPGSGRRRRSGTGTDPGPGPEQYGDAQHGTPAHGVPRVRGGHPEQRESGGGWGAARRSGDVRSAPAVEGARDGQGAQDRQGTRRSPEPTTPQAGKARAGKPQAGKARPGGPEAQESRAVMSEARKPRAGSPGSGESPAGSSGLPGPRREFLAAFETFDAPPSRAIAREAAFARYPGVRESADEAVREPSLDDRGGDDGDGGGTGGDGSGGGGGSGGGPDGTPDAERQPAKNGKGRALTGIAAAAVTTVLAVIVAGQVTDGGSGAAGARAADAADRGAEDDIASRSEGRATPYRAPAPAIPTYEQMMTRQFPLDPDLEASGDFTAVPGFQKAPGRGEKFRYRVDIESGLSLDGALFADAVQKTLNDDRSWAHDGDMTFERISDGEPDFVVTLASPGTTGVWCEKSGLDTTVDNVSCDSASTDRVMINAYRWAQGSVTFGSKAMLSYRQMLINHEVGHRLGHNHVSCRTPGALAPVMQQQTKSLDIDGIECRPNPWVYPKG